MIRICRVKGPTTLFVDTVTIGSEMYLDRFLSISRPKSLGVLPIATTFSTSGIVIRPSGRTVTVVLNSGLRQTKIAKLSPGPITYCDEANPVGGTGGGVPPPQPPNPTNIS